MSPHNTNIIVLISEQDKEVPQQLLSDDQSNSYCIVLASLSAVCCYLAIEFHTTTKEASKHTTYHVSNATYFFAMVGCLFCSSLSSFSLMTDGTFNTEK